MYTNNHSWQYKCHKKRFRSNVEEEGIVSSLNNQGKILVQVDHSFTVLELNISYRLKDNESESRDLRDDTRLTVAIQQSQSREELWYPEAKPDSNTRL